MSNRSDLFFRTLRGMASIAALFFFVCTASAQAPPTRRPPTPIETTPAVIAPAPPEPEPQEPLSELGRKKLCGERSDFDCMYRLYQRLAQTTTALEQRMNDAAGVRPTRSTIDLYARVADLEQKVNNLASPTPSQNEVDLVRRMRALEQRVNDLPSRPSSTPGAGVDLQPIQNRINVLQSRVASLEGRLNGSGPGKADGWADVWKAIDDIKRELARRR